METPPAINQLEMSEAEIEQAEAIAKRLGYTQCALCDIAHPYENNQSANGHSHPTIPLISDEEWLARTEFAVNRDGSLNKKVTHCETNHSFNLKIGGDR